MVTGDSTFPNMMYAYDLAGTLQFSFNMDSAVPDADLRHPIKYAFDSAGNIYVVSLNPGTTRHPLYKFDPTGSYLAQLGVAGNGSANGQCNKPLGLCFDASDNMYIVDTVNTRIQKWDSSGTYVSKWGTSGSGDGQFNFLGGNVYSYIAFDGTYLYVGDNGNRRIQKFDTSGTFITKWGSVGTGNGQFTTLNGVAVASDGTIWVVDDDWVSGTTRSRIQHFSNTGTYLGEYDSPVYGAGDGEFEHPNDIAIDADGNIYVADEYNFRIQKFDSSMTWISTFPVTGGGFPQGVGVFSAAAVVTFVPQIYRRPC